MAASSSTDNVPNDDLRCRKCNKELDINLMTDLAPECGNNNVHAVCVPCYNRWVRQLQKLAENKDQEALVLVKKYPIVRSRS